MKRKTLSLLVLAGTLVPLCSQAITGGPWDHLFPERFSRSNTDGVYEGVVSLSNGSGFIKFESQANLVTLDGSPADDNSAQSSLTGTASGGLSELAAKSNSVVFYQGNSYFGTTYGSVEALTGTVTGATTGQSTIVSNIEQGLQGLTETAGAAIDVSGLSETMNMAFSGKVTDRQPQIRFSATGDVNFLSRPPVNFQFISQTTAGAMNNPPTTTLIATIAQIAAGGSTSNSTTSQVNTSNTTQDSTTKTIVSTPADPTNGTTTTRTVQTGTGPNTSTTQVDSTVTEPTVSTGAPLDPDVKVSVRIFGGRVSRDGIYSEELVNTATGG